MGFLSCALRSGIGIAAISLSVAISGSAPAKDASRPAAAAAPGERKSQASGANNVNALIADGRQALEDNLLDYTAARLRNVRLVAAAAGFNAFCGEINTTNRMGGYGGWKPFIIPLGGTTFGNLLDKVAIAGQRSTAASFMGRVGSSEAGDNFNERQIATHCGAEGTRLDQVDYAPALSFGETR